MNKKKWHIRNLGFDERKLNKFIFYLIFGIIAWSIIIKYLIG
jgi:hypothetical protein